MQTQHVQWTWEQERRAFGAGEYRRGLDEAAEMLREQRRRYRQALLREQNPYCFAAVAVLDEMIALVERRERDATRQLDHEVTIWMAELERVTTQVLPVGGAK